MGLSKNLTKFRTEKGYTKQALARKSGLFARTIEYIEKEKSINPRIETLRKLAKALDVTVNDLIKE